MKKLHCDFCGKEMVEKKEGTEGIFRVAGTEHNLKFTVGIARQNSKMVRFDSCDCCLSCISEFVLNLVDNQERTSCAQDSPAQNTNEICHTAANSAMLRGRSATCRNRYVSIAHTLAAMFA